jgi:hypothetical protein
MYLAGEIAQHDLWFPPVELLVGYGCGITARWRTCAAAHPGTAPVASHGGARPRSTPDTRGVAQLDDLVEHCGQTYVLVLGQPPTAVPGELLKRVHRRTRPHPPPQSGVPPTFRTADPLRSIPEREGIRGRKVSEIHT